MTSGSTGNPVILWVVVGATAAATSTILWMRVRLLRSSKESYDVMPRTMLDFEALATQNKLSKLAKTYFGHVQELGVTVKACRSYLEGVRLQPRILVGPKLEEVDTSLESFGQSLQLPVWVAPTAFHGLACAENGEVATARGAGQAGAGYCYNFMLSSKPFTEVILEPGVKWLHLYMFEERDMVERCLQMAEATGAFSAVILTCDHPHTRVQSQMLPHFIRDMPTAYPAHMLEAPFFPNQSLAGGTDMTLDEVANFTPAPGEAAPGGQNSARLGWDDVKWIKSLTKLPVVCKGILCPEDALLAMEAGADGIVVSNHGGRQFDGAPPAIEVLPSIAHVIQKRIPIWVDSGIRTCTDVLKALCLGATGVLIGRPPLYALACDGAKGLSHMLDCLQYDLKADMMSLGVSNLSELGLHHVYPPDRQRILASIDAHLIKPPET